MFYYCVCTCVGGYEGRYGVGFLLPSGFWGPNSGHQVCTASAFTCEVIPLAYGRNLERLSPLVFLDSAISSTVQLLTLAGRDDCESWMKLSGPGCASSHPSMVGETVGLVFPAC